jgi:ScaI restriction endonuclease
MPEERWPDWINQAGVTRRQGGPVPRPKTKESPYFGVDDEGQRLTITKGLLAAHPLPGPDITSKVLGSWDSIFHSRLGTGFHMGREIKPSPQIMGFLLHALIPLELARDHDGWRAELTARDKDLVYIPNEQFSIEIKTSSHERQVFGNRSFGVDSPGKGKKAKDGYYITVNFEPWRADDKLPIVRMIRFGWLDHTDWVAQAAQTGQQSALPAVVDNTQFLILYEARLEENIIRLF